MKRITLLVTIALVVGILAIACTPTATPVTQTEQATTQSTTQTQATVQPTPMATPMENVNRQGQGGPPNATTEPLDENAGVMTAEQILALPVGDLSEEEAQGLLYMREEEKLARDVYLTLYDKWNFPVFSNIARSEQQHTDMVKALLDRYGLQDPAEGQGIGQFTNPDIQALYDKLVAQGSTSLADALKVGAAIEEIDILDLKERIAQTDNADIKTVYENLMSGSENHLRAFVSVLERQTGEKYQPQYLDPATYENIIKSAPSRGRGAGGAGQGGGYGRGQGLGNSQGRP